MLKGGGRGSLRVHASSTASARGHILQKRALTAQQRPSTPALAPLSASEFLTLIASLVSIWSLNAARMHALTVHLASDQFLRI